MCDRGLNAKVEALKLPLKHFWITSKGPNPHGTGAVNARELGNA